MELRLDGKIALVTGGSRGIGRAIVEKFAFAGAHTFFTYSSSSKESDEIVRGLTDKGCKVAAFQADVRDEAQMSSLIEKIESEAGGLDILVNNAGIIRDQLLLTMESEDWSQVLATNLTGAYNVIKPSVRGMMRKRKGSIINISSIAGSKPGRGHSNYAASKGGIEAMTKALAVELGGKGIRVNAVAPGMIETDMSTTVREVAGAEILSHISLKRFGKPEDIANAVMFLASDMSSYVTGEIIHVNGGVH